MKDFVERDVVLEGVKHHYAEGPDNGPAVVHLAAPKRYVAALTRLSARTG